MKDLSWFSAMEERIPTGEVRTRFAPETARASSSCALRTPTRAAWWRALWM